MCTKTNYSDGGDNDGDYDDALGDGDDDLDNGDFDDALGDGDDNVVEDI